MRLSFEQKRAFSLNFAFLLNYCYLPRGSFQKKFGWPYKKEGPVQEKLGGHFLVIRNKATKRSLKKFIVLGHFLMY